ncbi:hypothetical protein DL96DRAFT_1748889 [Flagelloscypha sp. PMI_526]|nr:hypothetical protein DL96DRAFT_1748889 [Flagelloscypha sp. PMI_526]
MAGGYGFYRTAEWVRQPQRIAVPPPKPVTPSTVEQAQQAITLNKPPSEKEITKRQRLAAFRGDATLLDPISNSPSLPPQAAKIVLKRAPPNPAKKGKKKEVAHGHQLAGRRLPLEREGEIVCRLTQSAEDKRFSTLGAFFDRDSDDEDSDSESNEESEEELTPHAQVDQIYGDDEDRQLPPRPC